MGDGRAWRGLLVRRRSWGERRRLPGRHGGIDRPGGGRAEEERRMAQGRRGAGQTRDDSTMPSGNRGVIIPQSSNYSPMPLITSNFWRVLSEEIGDGEWAFQSYSNRFSVF